ncbi:hypothetical protein Hypma_014037 [Hypsizygus marmoreus]|uniref:Uncharacterized protein n=1 Tax=Hypsizygus marmoreus TaxID=39966 RepID=A0A369K7J3_HYPMA|nr:hypothetical protein Hypma_014037 [Hypsizygus marmoreus]
MYYPPLQMKRLLTSAPIRNRQACSGPRGPANDTSTLLAVAVPLNCCDRIFRRGAIELRCELFSMICLRSIFRSIPFLFPCSPFSVWYHPSRISLRKKEHSHNQLLVATFSSLFTVTQRLQPGLGSPRVPLFSEALYLRSQIEHRASQLLLLELLALDPEPDFPDASQRIPFFPADYGVSTLFYEVHSLVLLESTLINGTLHQLSHRTPHVPPSIISFSAVKQSSQVRLHGYPANTEHQPKDCLLKRDPEYFNIHQVLRWFTNRITRI